MKKFFKIILVIFIVLLIMLGLISYFILSKLNKINYVNISKEDIQITDGIDDNLIEYRNIALLGIDSREDGYESGRSDCIIIASINQKSKEIKLVSVYRDTYLEIPGYGLDKVNHSYAYNGPALTMSTLNTNLDLNILEFVTVNFESTKDIIDEMGGVEITVTDAEATRIPNISSAGTYNLNGTQALAYGRIRKIDSDYVRTERMRTIVTAVFNKAKTMNIMQLNSLANKLLPEIYTNVPSKEIFSLIPKIASYTITESTGWPYKTSGIILNQVWYGPPITLESNVIELHKQLFNEDNYIPTNKVKEISQKIINKTGYR